MNTDVTPRALAEVACTLSLTASEVRIDCETRKEAEEVLDWLEAHVGRREAAEAASKAEIETLKRSGKALMNEKHKEAAEARLWFGKAQEWKAELAASKAREAALVEALGEMVYEVTHLSPQEDDGSHWCKISSDCLAKARAALTPKEPDA